MYKKIYVIAVVFCLALFSACTGKNQSTVTVSGIGTVLVNPDMAQMNLSFFHVAPTTKAAKDAVDVKIHTLLEILKDAGIEDNDIKTISLTYDAEMQYRNGRSVIVGQRAQQTLAITLHDIADDQEKLPSLLDRITGIDGIIVRNIMFDTDNKTELFGQSRELAYQKALDKANQYANLTGMKVSRALTITEGRNMDIFRAAPQSNVMYESAVADRGAAVPAGEQEITTEITATFLLK